MAPRLEAAYKRAQIDARTVSALRTRAEHAIDRSLSGGTLSEQLRGFQRAQVELKRLSSELSELRRAEPTLTVASRLHREIQDSIAIHKRVEPVLTQLVAGVRQLADANRRAASVIERWAEEREEAWKELAYQWEILAWRCAAYSRFAARLFTADKGPPASIDHEAVLREELAEIAAHDPRGTGISFAALDALVRLNGADRRYPGRGTRHGRYVRGS
ncbi:MAG TPA: hypothetical protein VFW29_08790 [Solirubrobacteraceae bacterium]|nr:hypothetical protein [Solirubrobacteraceae bacterium]